MRQLQKFWKYLSSNLVINKQHVYMIGCSVDRVLRDVEFALTAFLDVEGVFNNVEKHFYLNFCSLRLLRVY